MVFCWLLVILPFFHFRQLPRPRLIPTRNDCSLSFTQSPQEWFRFKIIHIFNVLSSLVDRKLTRTRWKIQRVKASKAHSKIRRRALTLPLSPDSSCEIHTPNTWLRFLSALQIGRAQTKSKKKIIQETMDQYHSPIFKLLFEIREMI